MDALAEARDRAAAQVTALAAQLAEVVASAEDSNADDEHDPEGHTIAYERAQLGALLDAARARLAALDDAIARAAEGTYGTCSSCGGAIGAERLAALPATRTCVSCAASQGRASSSRRG